MNLPLRILRNLREWWPLRQVGDTREQLRAHLRRYGNRQHLLAEVGELHFPERHFGAQRRLLAQQLLEASPRCAAQGAERVLGSDAAGEFGIGVVHRRIIPASRRAVRQVRDGSKL